MQFRIVALDPGGTTGWATYTADQIRDPYQTSNLEYYDEKWCCGQLGPEQHHNQLDVFLGTQRVELYHIVYESFEFRGGAAKLRDNINLDSKEYIGVVKRWYQENSEHVVEPQAVSLHHQTAAMAKGFISDDKIKRAELWWPNHVHAMDAMRHLLYTLVNHHGRRDLVKRWWQPTSV